MIIIPISNPNQPVSPFHQYHVHLAVHKFKYRHQILIPVFKLELELLQIPIPIPSELRAFNNVNTLAVMTYVCRKSARVIRLAEQYTTHYVSFGVSFVVLML